jgi:hypothetical protein
MQVLLHTPAAWFLLQHDEALYLDVNCTLSFSSLSVMIELNAEEFARYHSEGRAYIDELANDISFRPREYYARNNTVLNDEVSAAVQRWRNEGGAQ